MCKDRWLCMWELKTHSNNCFFSIFKKMEKTEQKNDRQVNKIYLIFHKHLQSFTIKEGNV